METACASRALPPGRDLLACLAQQRSRGLPWLLDSARVDGRLGCTSFAGWDPHAVLRARGRRCELEIRRAARPGEEPGTRRFEADPFEALRSVLPPRLPSRGSAGPPFVGGAVVSLGYELGRHVEPIRLHAEPDLPFPDLCALLVDRVIALDHATGGASAHALGFGEDAEAARVAAERNLAPLLAAWLAAPRAVTAPASTPPAPSAGESLRVRSDFDEAEYMAAVERLREHIFAGDFYQANLTQRLEVEWAGDPWRLYGHLRRGNPAPFAAYLELPEGAILGSSPERFVRVGAGGDVESRPIKGTRPRASDRLHDRALARELRASEKECAENLMIVDLVRNDLGRVCETGSVHVPELMTIESYATVHQMVSTVRGQLREGADIVDLLRATFPPGSMTGAPKIAAIDHLAEIEPVARGVYSGALGYLDARGGADLAVVIRTILATAERAYIQVGGGIVADSEPRAEYRETWDKARALLAAVEAAQKAPEGTTP